MFRRRSRRGDLPYQTQDPYKNGLRSLFRSPRSLLICLLYTSHAEAEGYDDFDKKLFVNSAAANIDISLTGDGTTSDNDMTEGTESVEAVSYTHLGDRRGFL